MFPITIIIFREILEISIITSVIIAATTAIPKRLSIISIGFAIGIIGSLLIALFTDSISQAFEGTGQEIFNASIIFTAVIFLSWTVIWMKKHGREMSQNFTQMGKKVLEGEKSIYAFTAVVALSIFREGTEIVLFLYGKFISGQNSSAEIISGSILGTVIGVIVGVMLYYGLLKASKRHLFTVTSWMLILLTAGMASQGADFLTAAGIIPELIDQVWDSSKFISGEGVIGTILNAVIGYTPKPTGMQLLFYLSTLMVVGFFYQTVGKKKS